jgi:hypothetical protein
LVENTETLEDSGGAFSTIALDPPWVWGDEGDVITPHQLAYFNEK